MASTIAHTDNFPVIIVGGPLDGIYNRAYVMNHFHNGRFTQDCSNVRQWYKCQREELDLQPKINGYLGPMWDGNRLRYEFTEAYKSLSF